MPKDSFHKSEPWTIATLLQWATGYFSRNDIDSPRSTAEILLGHALGLARIDLYLRHDQPLTDHELARFKPLVQRRARREPVAYIVGEKEFWGMALAVAPGVLIPRPETECLVETVLEKTLPTKGGTPRRVLELGVGSGAIVLALAKERPENRYVGIDRSAATLNLARRNARRHGLADRIALAAGDWFRALRPDGKGFDLIVSNPPYIASGVLSTLAPEIARYEPALALDGGDEGLDAVALILSQAPAHLGPGGHLVLEIGYDQADAVRRLAEATGAYGDVNVRRDYSGHDRVVHLRRRML